MRTITDNYIEYLHNALEPDDGYPYPEMYQDSKMYLAVHDVIKQYNASNIQNDTLKDLGSLAKCFPWHRRYSFIVQRGTFYSNITKLEAIRLLCNDEDQWKIKLDLEDIPIEMANFEICYCWMNPGRLFSDDFRKLDKDVCSVPPFQSVNEANAWRFVSKMYKKILAKHLPMCTVEEFLARSL